MRMTTMLLVLALPVSLLLGADSPTTLAAAEPECSAAGDGSLVDSVSAIHPDEDGRVAVGFREHAALYFIRQDDPCRAVWEPRLIESLDTGLPLRISFRIKNREITAVVAAESEKPAE